MNHVESSKISTDRRRMSESHSNDRLRKKKKAKRQKKYAEFLLEFEKKQYPKMKG